MFPSTTCPGPGFRAVRLLQLLALGVLPAITVGVIGEVTAPGLVERPLASVSEVTGSKMFTIVPPEESGVRTENRYSDPRMWGSLYQEFEGGSIGTGVAIGDYDGDGRPDLFVVSKTESCRLFRNLGNYRFEDVTAKAGVGDQGAAAAIWKNGATFVDVNNDGRLDLYVCRYNAPNLLYINQGDGTFREEAHAYGLDVKDASVMACFCDYDRDGRLDVYIVTNILDSATHPNGQRGYLFHNNGNGTFTDVTDRAGISGEAQSHSATWWDFDNDGWPDLYVANDYGVPDKLYHNNRDGTFTNVIDQVLPHTTHYSMGSDQGDVNNDGRIDLLVADMAATTHEKDQNTIAESRERLGDPTDPAAAPKYMRSALFLNTGTSRCLEAAYLAGIAASNWTWSPRLADLDNDGRLDLFVTNGFNRDPNPDVHARSMRAETTAQRIRILKDAPVLVEKHLAFRNLGDLEFENVAGQWGLDQTGVSFGCAMGDFAGTGNLDMVYSNYGKGVTLLRNNCRTGHRIVVDLRGTVSNRFGVGALVRIESALGVQAQQLMLARGYMSSSEPMVHFGLGSDTVVRRMTISWPSGLKQAFEDLPVDRNYTVTEPSGPAPSPARTVVTPPPGQFVEVSGSVGLAIGDREEVIDERAAQPLIPIRLNRRGPALAVEESRSSATVVIGGTTVDPLRVLRETDGRFVESGDRVRTGTNVDDGPVLLFDADGDGQEDLLVTKGGNSLPAGAPEYQPKLYLGDGHGGFRPAPTGALPEMSVSAGAAVAADFDRDGRLDVFIGGRVVTGQYPDAPQSVLLRNLGGRFEDVTDTVAPGLRQAGMVTSALWSDVDGDGWPDLLVTLEWGPVKYFHNDHGRKLEDWTQKAGFASAGTGWWTSIAAADFNGDGRMDYVVGNVGLNTQYHADPKHPALLFAGDFKGDGSTQLIEGYYEGDKLYPWRTWREYSKIFPGFLRRYPTADSYASRTLQEIFGADKLAAADRYAATELRSGVFLSQPDGTHRFEPLPHIAQISPLQGIVTGDFNGDGHADIYAVQNSYAPIPCVGRFDGGLSQLLLGDGRGNFTPVTVAESGLSVPGDAKGLAAFDIDHDGWADFLVTRNYGTTLCFRNRGSPHGHPLEVVLSGPPGNPTGVGARITVQLSHGERETSEVCAGSGYYSQSTAACFFGYGDGNPPVRLTVRWSDGTTTERSVPPDKPRLIVSK